MALPSSGSLSLSQIQSEWGGSNPISLSEYYLGSLPTGRTNYGTIPSSGAIDIGDFYGSNAAVTSIQIASGNSTYIAPSQYVAEQRNITRSDLGGASSPLVTNHPNFTMNGRNHQFVRIGFFTSLTPNLYQVQIADMTGGVAIGSGTTPTSHPTNSGWTTIVLAGNGSSRTFTRTSAAAFSTSNFIIGSNLIGVGLWDFSGGANSTQIFPASHNTTNFTVTLTP